MSAEHVITDIDGGAQCSCGRVFNVWTMRSRPGDSSNDIARRKPLARANARRHAAAANAKAVSA